ncbi:Mu transposase C-terminal domain-containing protein [Streptomyces sp. NPDC006530]|uniref:Mu transposase C-terminal domain-containing protein n=1 Tax=Streptomyces sp. NPDC006530 TaxID=3364750 RepID=UPI0036A8D050
MASKSLADPVKPCGHHGAGRSSSRQAAATRSAPLPDDQFSVELDEDRVGQIEHLAELNRLFTASVETVYHRTVHSETGQPPIERWLGSIPRPLPLPCPADLREAFLWSEFRTVTKTATVSLHGNTYEVDPMLVGMKVELVFDPFDLTEIEVRTSGKTAGEAVPHRVGRNTHPKARRGRRHRRSRPRRLESTT